jgi:hypothetical protein
MTLFSRIGPRLRALLIAGVEDVLNALLRCQSFATHPAQNVATVNISQSKNRKLNRQGRQCFALSVQDNMAAL